MTTTSNTPAKKTAAKKTAARKPAGARKPADRKPKAVASKSAAVKAEALGEDIVFTYDGVEYHITREAAEDIEVLELFEKGMHIRAVEAILSPGEWDRFKEKTKAKHNGRVPLATFEEFADAVMSGSGGN